MKLPFLSLVVCLTAFSTGFSQEIPGDYPPPVRWFRAGDPPATTFHRDTLVYDSLYISADGVPDTLTYLQGAFNYNDAVYLDGEGACFHIPLPAPGAAEGYTVFTVFYTADTTEQGLWVLDTLAGQTTRRLLAPGGTGVFGEDASPVFDHYERSEQRAVINRMQLTGQLADSQEDTLFLHLGTFGSQDSIVPLHGYLAEYIVFDQALDGVAMAQAETYLSIKYGIHLERGNYVSSAGTILWHRKQDSTWSHRIAGIGRDDHWGLYQKQSKTQTSGVLIGPPAGETPEGSAAEVLISLGAPATTNTQNTRHLPDQAFLLWGDNDGDMAPDEASETLIKPLQRRWLIKTSGGLADPPAGETPEVFELRINKNTLPVQDSVYWLLIDRNPEEATSSGFSAPEYIRHDTILDDTLIVFSNIRWDTDGSGSDVFSFGTSERLVLEAGVVEYPRCSYSEDGVLRFITSGGKAPYTYEIENLRGFPGPQAGQNPGGFVAETDTLLYGDLPGGIPPGTGGGAAIPPGLPGGLYHVHVTDATGQTAETEIELSAPGVLPLDLCEGAEKPCGKVLRRNERWDFDVSEQIPDTLEVTYAWEGPGVNGGQASNSKIRAKDPGLYTVSVSFLSDIDEETMCVYRDSMRITNDPLLRFEVTPSLVSHTTDNSATIHLLFNEPTDIRLSLVSAGGTELWVREVQGKRSYNFNETFTEAGMYTLVLQTAGGYEAKKVMVVK